MRTASNLESHALLPQAAVRDWRSNRLARGKALPHPSSGRACGEDTMGEGEVPKGLEGLGRDVGRPWRTRLRGRRWSKGEEGT